MRGPVPSAARLQVQGLRVSYPDGESGRTLIEDLSFSAGPGDLVCIAGRSGSGKTSILRRIAGLVAPARNQVRWNDTDVFAMSADDRADLRRNTAAYLDQETSLLEDLTCLENATIMSIPDGAARVRTARKRAAVWLETLELAERANVLPETFSGGERQRAALARVLTRSTPGIIADEPTSSLDRRWADEVVRLLRGHADRGGTVVVASHDPNLAELADHVIALEQR